MMGEEKNKGMESLPTIILKTAITSRINLVKMVVVIRRRM